MIAGSMTGASMISASMFGAELTESQTALRVFLAAGGLVLLGIVGLVLTIWWWRSTKPESPALGPLEVMSDRKWLTAAESERRRLIEQHRPDGAASGHVAPEPVDLSLLARATPSTFDDLRDPVDEPAVAEVDPEAAEIEVRSRVREDAADDQVADPSDDAAEATEVDTSAVDERDATVAMSRDATVAMPHRAAASSASDDVCVSVAGDDEGSSDPAVEQVADRSSDQAVAPRAGA